jgi:phage gp36-like protein
MARFGGLFAFRVYAYPRRMAYCTISDLQLACGGGDLDLIEVFDANRDGAVTGTDVTVMNGRIDEAQAFIDSRIGKQVRVPVAAPIPTVLVKMTARLAVYLQREAKRMVDPDTHGMTYKADLKTLEDIRDGVITLGVDPKPIGPSDRIDQVADRPFSKDVSRRNLAGFGGRGGRGYGC